MKLNQKNIILEKSNCPFQFAAKLFNGTPFISHTPRKKKESVSTHETSTRYNRQIKFQWDGSHPNFEWIVCAIDPTC